MARVTIEQGVLRGGKAVSENGLKFYEFLSIPYAKPPTGNLRFKSPQPPEAWQGERDATKSVLENTAYQKSFFTEEITGSEDCLYLNVYTPNLPFSGSKYLPVMVYIHAGGFIVGNGTIKDETNPEFLVDNGVVVVSINYRLGVLGFLSLDIPEAAGSMGLKDQVKALDWVQKNIGKFGGDKDNVTIFGVSAGSASVEYLMLSPLSRGLFHKAILQSGSTLNDWAIRFQYEQLALNLADKLEYKGDKNDKRALYNFFLSVPAAELSDAAIIVTNSFSVKTSFFGFVPIVEKVKDGAFLTTHPYKLIKEGKFAKVPVLRGFCDMEGSIIEIMKPHEVNELKNNRRFANYWSYELHDDKEGYSAKLYNAYLKAAKSEKDLNKAAVDFFGDLQFCAGIWLASIFFARHGITEYVYKFTYGGKLNFFKNMSGMTKEGAAHGDDLGYVFKIAGLTTSEKADILFRSKITKMWTNFAKTSNPTPKECTDISIEWPKFTEQSKVLFNLNKEITIEENYEPERMAIFEDIYSKYEK